MADRKVFVGMMRELFRVKREETVPALLMTLVFLMWQVRFVARFFGAVAHRMHGNGSDFIHEVPVSGFDAYSYTMMTDWIIVYEPYRHPLVAPLFYPLYLLNQLLINIFGINCSQFVIAFLLLAAVFYAYVFLYRILRELVGLCRFDANLLSVMLFSFAYSLLSMIAPDLFGFSLTMLMGALYVAGKAMKEGQKLSVKQTWWLFLPVAGMTLSNGLKVFIDALFVNGRQFFRLRYLILAAILPSALLFWVAFAQEQVREDWNSSVFARADRQGKALLWTQIADTTSFKDSAYIEMLFKKELKQRIRARYQRDHQYDSTPRQKVETMGKGMFLSWTDVSTPRWQSIVENVFGEGIQLHEDFLLRDVFRGRPLIVHYRHAYSYAVEGILVLLFLAGIWCGRRSKFLWMCLSGLAVDAFLHMLLGFGIDEVYIMTSHWAFVIPIAIACLLAATARHVKMALRSVLLFLTLWLWLYNGSLFWSYLA